MSRDIILKDLGDSITYSIMVDSTQDVAVKDQLDQFEQLLQLFIAKTI